jgi:hypothetical protein
MNMILKNQRLGYGSVFFFNFVMLLKW